MSDKETEDGAVVSPQNVADVKQHGLFGASGIQLTDSELKSGNHKIFTPYKLQPSGNKQASLL